MVDPVPDQQDPRLRIYCRIDPGRLGLPGVQFIIKYNSISHSTSSPTFNQDFWSDRCPRIAFFFEPGSVARKSTDTAGDLFDLDELSGQWLGGAGAGSNRYPWDTEEVNGWRTRRPGGSSEMKFILRLCLRTYNSIAENKQDHGDFLDKIRNSGNPGSVARVDNLIRQLSLKRRQEFNAYMYLRSNDKTKFIKHTLRPMWSEGRDDKLFPGPKLYRHGPLWPFDWYPSEWPDIDLQPPSQFRNGMFIEAPSPGNPQRVRLLPRLKNRLTQRPLMLASTVGEIREQQSLERSLIRYAHRPTDASKMFMMCSTMPGLLDATDQKGRIESLDAQGLLRINEPFDQNIYLGRVFLPEQGPQRVATGMLLPPDGTMFLVILLLENGLRCFMYGRVVFAPPEQLQGSIFVMVLHVDPGDKWILRNLEAHGAKARVDLVPVNNRVFSSQKSRLLRLIGTKKLSTDIVSSLLRKLLEESAAFPTHGTTEIRMGEWPPLIARILQWPFGTRFPWRPQALNFLHGLPNLIRRQKYYTAISSIDSPNFRAVLISILAMRAMKVERKVDNYAYVMVVMGDQRDMPEFCGRLDGLMQYPTLSATQSTLKRDPVTRNVAWPLIRGRVTKFTATDVECEDKSPAEQSPEKYTADLASIDPKNADRRRINLYFDYVVNDPRQLFPRQVPPAPAHMVVPQHWSMGRKVQDYFRVRIQGGTSLNDARDYYDARKTVLDRGPRPAEDPLMETFLAQEHREKAKAEILKGFTHLLITDCKTAASRLVRDNFQADVVFMIGANKMTLAEGLTSITDQRQMKACFVFADPTLRNIENEQDPHRFYRWEERPAASEGENEAWNTWRMTFFELMTQNNINPPTPNFD
ncbi:MAG: hypothetical protein Q9227_001343 [Pyrenula ochraceoflavens]